MPFVSSSAWRKVSYYGRLVLRSLGLTSSRFDCDTCKYNWRNACLDPKRPNKRVCLQYARR
ncbi:MAG TPA: hypothetical protein GXX29_11965 [Firmicutes bacterium]|nr:hypothetical protein [Bacillota bacterium]